jgi:hypothetical protein
MRRRPILTTLPEDRGRLINWLYSVQFYTAPKETFEPTKILFCNQNGCAFAGDFFPVSFLFWFACCICAETNQILIIDVWEVYTSESLEKELISYLSSMLVAHEI